MSTRRIWPIFTALIIVNAAAARAQDRPYFVTYDHYLEEPGNLEVALANTAGMPRGGNPTYSAPWLELEYGVKGWWTTEFYLEGVSARGDSSGFSGWRLENRFRPFKSEHRINPVIYVEYESINEASRIQKEIVGAGPLPFEPIADLRREHMHEVEAKLILSSAISDWNVSENLIFEKNLTADEGVEFGYSVGVSRSLGGLASGTSCRFCRENLRAGFELFGGLGTSQEYTLNETRHYLAPAVAWRVSDRSTLKASTGFGLTEASDHFLLRIGWSYELSLRGRR
jgi:hypothetical protein